MPKNPEAMLDDLLEKAQLLLNEVTDWAEKRLLGLLGLARRFMTPVQRESGMLAFVLHRVTGLFLLAYLFIHIATVSTVNFSQRDFDDLMEILVSPPFLLFDVALFGAVLFHSINGIRITLFDAGVGTRHQKGLFWGVLVLSGLLLMAFLYALAPLLAKAGSRGG
ncbi:MAG: succinate dehydrogenase, cytochrome b556 subunit [Euryarchaeota archaeon]|nr:succinate dehydrogenase, cytochrome b556 subunit [Euryarchaeota archaeon]